MKIPVLMTLLVLAVWAVGAQKEAREQRRRPAAVSTWCRSKVRNKANTFMRNRKSHMIRCCMNIVYGIMSNKEAGCKSLRNKMRNRWWYRFFNDYVAASSLVYEGLCTGSATVRPTIASIAPTIPTTPITSAVSTFQPGGKKPQECGKSESLKNKALRVMKIAQRRIYGGVEVKDCSIVPWQVRLNAGGRLCGGSIISDRHILTASHCLDKVRKLDDLKVTIAEHHLKESHFYQQIVPIVNITKHHDYEPNNFVSDIAVLTLKHPIVFNNPCLEIICRDPSFKFDGKSCLVSGWGKQEKGHASSILKVVKLQANHGNNCKKVFGIKELNYVYNKEQMICAGHVSGGKDSCKGDSGSPLVCFDVTTDRFVQIGVVSHGTGCGEKGHPGVYSSVVYFHEWINKIMAENSYTDEHGHTHSSGNSHGHSAEHSHGHSVEHSHAGSKKLWLKTVN